jgi:hypothetical protein
LVNRLVAEFQKDPARKLTFASSALNPTGGTISTVDDLMTAVRQSHAVAQLAFALSPESHAALVSDIVKSLKPATKKAAAKKKAPAAKKRGGR